MNIFYLDNNPEICAEYHNDKHVVKMILETAQLLCTVHWVCGDYAPYKQTHKNHPSSIWTRSSIKHYEWLVNLGICLCEEYQYRYGKVHKTQEVIEWCKRNKPNIPDLGWSEPPQAMPEQYKVQNNSVLAYRNYYMGEKKDFCNWKKRDVPEWFLCGI